MLIMVLRKTFGKMYVVKEVWRYDNIKLKYVTKVI